MARDTREHILKKGIELITEKGFHNTGISEILLSASVPKGSFYHYFGSKNEFGREIVETASAEFLNCLQEYCNRDLPPLERLRLYMEDKIEHMTPCQCNCLFGKLSQEVGEETPELADSLQAVFNSWNRILADLLREARERGELKNSEDPEMLARFILAGWEGAISQSRVRRDTTPLREFSTLLFSFLTG